ncbi:hypothetical protein N7507_000439 [Penicillium longicatenatum]|nr:hypothetical protein N7507_000439 [Penicillium longicatenatum]
MSLSDSEDSVVLVSPGDIRDFNEENILPLSADELKNIRDWLQPTPYDLDRSDFSRHLASYLQGTGQWLISTNTYIQWHHGDENGLLWIKGVPGSGKSVMAASIIHQLGKKEVPVLYFFFRQIIDANHRPVAALRDWLCQLLPFSPPLQVRLRDVYLRKKRPIDSLALSDLWKDLKFALSHLPRAYCVTDALDEMDQGNDDFLHSLAELGQWRPANVKILITSRPVVAVESALRPFHIPHIQLDERFVDIDIAAYVEHRLRNSSIPHEYWSLVTEAVPGRANGLFLYARLSMDAFVKPGADPQVVLETLPADLNVMYNDLLREHAKRSNVPDEFQLLILQFVTHATRPLRLLEVAEMAKATRIPFAFGACSLKEIKDLVRAACGPLLQILHDETVSVVHHSFTEFLKGFTRTKPLNPLGYPILEAGPTHQRLAMACMDYLTSGCLENLEIKKRSQVEEFFRPKKAQQSRIRLQFPFLEYAAANWYIHARRAALAGADMSSFYMTLNGFVANDQRFVAWLDIDWPEIMIQGLTPLHAAARTGLSQYATHLLQQADADPNAKSSHGDTPLYWAALSGYADVVQVLIDNGADPDGEANQGYKPIHQAVIYNHADVVKVLLANGVDILTPKTRDTPERMCRNAETSIGHTPWMYACMNGQVEALTELLCYIKDPDTLTQGLFWSAGSGHAACLDLILQHPGTEVNSKHSGQTPLFKACCIGDMSTIKLLLKAGADPNILYNYPSVELRGRRSRKGRLCREPEQNVEPRGYTALHALCGITKRMSNRHPAATRDCVSLLLKAGADLHVKCPKGETALHLACLNNIEVVKLLLHAGADPTAETDSGNTIIHTDGSTDKELLPILLESGLVNINELMTKGRENPLHLRLGSDHPEHALELLKYKPDVNMSNSDGNRALHVLLNHWRFGSVEDVMDALLSAGANPNLQNVKGETPLHVIRHLPGYELVSKLVKAGGNLEIRDLQGQTALFKSVKSDTKFYNTADDKATLSKTFIQLGARLDTRDIKGRTLLHQVVESISYLDYLTCRMDFHPSVVDNKGNTLLHEAASKKCHSEKLPTFIHLTHLAVDIDQPNNRGKTVLHKICARKPSLLTGRFSENPTFDFVINKCKNLSPRDANGVQPLHVAAAISEKYVFKLLDAGVNPCETTNQGMTVLHVAARARQPGIIGLVLSKLSGLEDAAFEGFVNQKSAEGNTALHYACCAGRPESVDLLLDAGADPNLPGKDGCTPFGACAEFEFEQSRWKRVVEAEDTQSGSTKARRAASIFISNHDLPADAKSVEESQWRQGTLKSELDSTRLDEILLTLVLHGAKITGNGSSLRGAFHNAVLNQRDYTAECLLRSKSMLHPDLNLLEGSIGEGFIASKIRLEAERSSLRQEGCKSDIGGMTDESKQNLRASYSAKLLGLRQYDMLEQRVSQVDVIELYQSTTPINISLLHSLARFGLTNVLKCVCTREAALKFDDHNWCKKGEIANNLHMNSIEPLLMVACDRQIPNMGVVRFLIEEMGVNINATCRNTDSFISQKQRQTVIVSDNSALHDIAMGKTWWNVHEALPYLIRKGADLELRNMRGDTPLHVAVNEKRPMGVFYKEAVQILLEAGADANAVNYRGDSCLSKAGSDTGLINLLLSYGAKVSSVAILSAIELQEVELLEFFLAQGEVANLRRPTPEIPENIPRMQKSWVTDCEVYPLFHAAFYKAPSSQISNHLTGGDPTLSRRRMMTALLRHGADPYATFIRHQRVNDELFDEEFEDAESEDEPKSEWKLETCTIIHEILHKGLIAEPLFDFPSLQLEARDPNGQTLLLAASRGPINRVEDLLARGADVTAQDNEGKTVVHNLMGREPDETNEKCLKDIFHQSSKLVNTPDKSGDTPLYHVLKAAKKHLQHIDLLLEHGADPLRPDSEGNTALHFFVKDPSTYKSRIEQFQSLGVDINARNRNGNSPLFEYIAHGALRARQSLTYYSDEVDEHLEDVCHLRYLKEAGADVFAINNRSGSSLLHILAGRTLGHPVHGVSAEERVLAKNIVNCFKFLTNMGLDPMREDAQQRTCLDIAAACGNEHILKLFQETPAELNVG